MPHVRTAQGLDTRAAWGAVAESSHAGLPGEFKGTNLEMRAYCHYDMEPTD
jgi:hypothetical protein